MRLVGIILILLTFETYAQPRLPVFRVFENGMEQWHKQDFDRAIIHFNEVIARDASHADAYYYRGSSYEHIKEYDDAYLDYKMYLGLNETSEAWLTYGMLCVKMKYFEEAEAVFRKLLNEPAGTTNMLFYEVNSSTNMVDGIFTTQGNVKGRYYHQLGRINFEQGDYSEAIALYDSAIVLLSDKAEFYIDRAEAYQQLGRKSSYELNLRIALAIDPANQRAQYHMAEVMKGAQPEKAMDYYSERIESEPENPAPYRLRGFNRMKAGDLKGAMSDFSKAIELDPTEPTSFINRGILREKSHMFESAIADYSQAIELSPNDSRAFLNRGNVLYKLREFQEALNDYTVAIFYDKKFGTAYYQRGLAFYKVGNRPAGCADLKKAIELGSEPATRAYNRICNIN